MIWKKWTHGFIGYCVTIVGCFSMIMAVGACGGGNDAKNFNEEVSSAQKIAPLSDLWQEELDGSDLSDFERDVLKRAVKTGRIEQDDYEQAHAKYLQCMTTAGYDQLAYDKLPNGLYSLSDDAVIDNGYADQMVACSEGTTRVIEADYRDQQDNPDRYKDHGIIAVQCLRDAGVVGDDYTAAEFNRSVEKMNSGGARPQDAFSFPLKSDDSQALYCLYLGGLSLKGNFDTEE